MRDDNDERQGETVVAQAVTPRSRTSLAGETAVGPAQTRLAWLLMDIVMTVLVLASTARYVINHGMNDLATVVLSGAAAVLAGYLARRALRPPMHPAWLAVVCLLWLALVAIAPSFGWCVVVLAFAALRILNFWRAVVVVAVLIVGVIAATLRISDHFDPTVVAGPICLAVLAVATYRALNAEAERRQRLLDDLLRTQDDLAVAERTAGALSERQRLSREIHDSVTQDLASVSLLFMREGVLQQDDSLFDSAVGARALASLPLGDSWKLTGGLGVVRFEDEVGDAGRNVTRQKTSPMISLSVMVRSNRRWSLGAEIASFTSAHATSAGLRGQFHF